MQEEQTRHFQRELQSDLYRGTEIRHRDMLAKLKVRVFVLCGLYTEEGGGVI